MDIKKLNLLHESNACKMNYKPNPNHRRIDVYFTLYDEVIIIGVIDNNYIFWQSITSIMDKETNALIFNYITNCDYEIVSNIYKALPNIGTTYKEFEEMYYICIVKGRSIDTEWETPFGHNYGSHQLENNGRYFSNDIAVLPTLLKRKCEIRNAGGIYINMLRKYVELLNKNNTDSVKDYYSKKPIIDILESESYIKLSEDIVLRNLYNEAISKCNDLYNAYMSAVR